MSERGRDATKTASTIRQKIVVHDGLGYSPTDEKSPELEPDERF